MSEWNMFVKKIMNERNITSYREAVQVAKEPYKDYKAKGKEPEQPVHPEMKPKGRKQKEEKIKLAVSTDGEVYMKPKKNVRKKKVESVQYV